MRAPGAVEEVEVQHDPLPVAGQAGRQLTVHLVEEQGLVPVGAGRLDDGLAGQRRDEHLGFEPGGQHLRRLRHLGGQHAVLDQEHVRVEPRALVARTDLADEAVDPHRLTARRGAFERDDVVELEEAVRRDGDPELERGRVLGAEHAPDGIDPGPGWAPGGSDAHARVHRSP